MTHSKVLLLLVVIFLVVRPISAQSEDISLVYYMQDFEHEIGNEWSTTSTSVTLLEGRQYLGEFYNDTVQLQLHSLPSHSSITVAFDLFIIGSWDGNWSGGEDFWSFGLSGEQPIIYTTFDNQAFYSDHSQAYPHSFPNSIQAPRSGTTENNTLGYLYAGTPMDAVYHLVYSFPHNNSGISLSFSGSGLEGGIEDESWGIDNITVYTLSDGDNLVPYSLIRPDYTVTLLYNPRTFTIVNGEAILAREIANLERRLQGLETAEFLDTMYNYFKVNVGEIDALRQQIEEGICQQSGFCEIAIQYSIGSRTMDTSGIGNVIFGYTLENYPLLSLSEEVISNWAQRINRETRNEIVERCGQDLLCRIVGFMEVRDLPDDSSQRQFGHELAIRIANGDVLSEEMISEAASLSHLS